MQYYVDGTNYATDDCDDLATSAETAEYVFPINSTHTIGARLVQFHTERERNGDVITITRVCTAYSGVANQSVTIGSADNQSKYGQDRDKDGVSDALEDSFLNTSTPAIYTNYLEEAQSYGITVKPSAITLRIGLLVFKEAAPRVEIMANYNVLWPFDFGCGGHDYDTEPFAYLLQPNVADAVPWQSSQWLIAQTKTSAHDGTSCQHIESANSYKSAVYVSAAKHANYLHLCNGDTLCSLFCADYCSINTFAGVAAHNVGNTSGFSGNCGHSEHLFDSNPGYTVPTKWISMMGHFSGRYKSPFNKQ